uniref:Hairy-related 8.2 n=1 Tax=Echeneis naucrates TaxID=173247 RepID=A0A665VP09_ECHNA
MTASALANNVGKHPSAKEERKLRKPLIERKRRERINNCLNQLKETVIGAFRLDQSKLEKADILEMTVKHLQNIQSNKFNGGSTNPTAGLEAQQKYSTGYIQCMHEVHNMLLTCDWMDKTLGSRLLNHLLKSLPRSTNEHPASQPTSTSIDQYLYTFQTKYHKVTVNLSLSLTAEFVKHNKMFSVNMLTQTHTVTRPATSVSHQLLNFLRDE